MDKAERESIINEAVERALLMLPEVVGNLMASAATKAKLAEKFYKDHPQFNSHRQVAAAIIEKMENSNFSLSIENIMEKAVPEIEKAIASTKHLDMLNVNKPKNNLIDYGEF